MPQINFTLTPKQLIDASRAHNRTKWPRFVFVITIVSICIGTVLAWKNNGDFVSMILFFTLTMLAASVVLFIVTQIWTIPRLVRRNLRHIDHENLNYDCKWDDEWFTLRTIDGHTTYKLKKFIKWKSSKGMIMLYRLPSHFYIIPDSAFADGQQRDHLIDLLTENGVMRQ